MEVTEEGKQVSAFRTVWMNATGNEKDTWNNAKREKRGRIGDEPQQRNVTQASHLKKGDDAHC